jgi:predicted phosphodiesterase
MKEASLHEKEATWQVDAEFPDAPIGILLATDIHYGSVNTDYDLLKEHLSIVEDTPNFFMVTNGDHVDNFNVTGKWATGVYENPLPPQIQTKAFIERLKQIDAKGKLGVMSFGNHDNFAEVTGYDWFDTFATDLKAPVFKTGGFLHILDGEQHYGLALTHKYWGSSKLNPTNAAKRFWEHEYPQADIVFLGHTHQSEVLHWERGGKDRIAVIGGTYKSEDNWARKNGIGGRSGSPGIALVVHPKEHRMLAFKDIRDAADYVTAHTVK